MTRALQSVAKHVHVAITATVAACTLLKIDGSVVAASAASENSQLEGERREL